MKLSKTEQLAVIFKALGEPTRLRIFEALRSCETEVGVNEAGHCCPTGQLSVGEVCCQFGQSMSTVSHHLKELRLAGLIHTHKRGRTIYCAVNPHAVGLIQQFLNERSCSSPE